MKCAKCMAELPGQAQFCMKCGTPVSTSRPLASGPLGGTPRTRTLPLAPPKRSNPLPWIIAGIAIVTLGAFGAVAYSRARNPTDRPASAGDMGRLTDLNGRAHDMGNLTDKSGRISDIGPLTSKPGQIPPTASDPVEIIDYLKHLRETERARLILTKQQTAQLLTLSATLPAGNMTAEMTDSPETAHKDKYNKMQSDFAKCASDWEALNTKFLSYPKPVPASCATLRDKYLQAVAKTSSSITKVGNSFASAMSGNPQDALDALTKMQGDQGIDQACELADVELAAVCDKFRIHKDFDIRAEGGSANPFGVGR